MRRAFTFLELIVVIAIISIILSIGVVKLGTLDTIREKNEFNTIIRDLKYARNIAMVSRMPVTVELTLTKGHRIRKSGLGDEVIKSVNYEYITRTDSTLSQKKIQFNKFGRPSSSGALVYKGKNRTYKLTIAVASGKVNIKEE